MRSRVRYQLFRSRRSGNGSWRMELWNGWKVRYRHACGVKREFTFKLHSYTHTAGKNLKMRGKLPVAKWEQSTLTIAKRDTRPRRPVGTSTGGGAERRPPARPCRTGSFFPSA